MSEFPEIRLTILVLVFAMLALSSDAKAGPVSVTLTNTATALDASNGQFTIIGFFTNTGTAAFTANSLDVVFSPNMGPMLISADTTPPDCCPYSRPVPGMSSSPVLPLLDFSLFSWPGEGVYTGTVTFSGLDTNGVAITTAPVEFTVNVPVPEPATMLLLSSGLIALGASARRRRNAIKAIAGTHRQATPEDQSS